MHNGIELENVSHVYKCQRPYKINITINRGEYWQIIFDYTTMFGSIS